MYESSIVNFTPRSDLFNLTRFSDVEKDPINVLQFEQLTVLKLKSFSFSLSEIYSKEILVYVSRRYPAGSINSKNVLVRYREKHFHRITGDSSCDQENDTINYVKLEIDIWRLYQSSDLLKLLKNKVDLFLLARKQ